MAFDPWRERDASKRKPTENPFTQFLPDRTRSSPATDYMFTQSRSPHLEPIDMTPVEQIDEERSTGIIPTVFNYIAPAVSGARMIDAALPGDPGTAVFNKMAGSDKAPVRWAAIALDALLAPITVVEAAAFIGTGGSSTALTAARASAIGAKALKVQKSVKASKLLNNKRVADAAVALSESKKLAAAKKISGSVLKTTVPKGVKSKGDKIAVSYILGRNVGIDAAVHKAASTEAGQKLMRDKPEIAIALGLVTGVAAFGTIDTAAKIATGSTIRGSLMPFKAGGIEGQTRTRITTPEQFDAALANKAGATGGIQRTIDSNQTAPVITNAVNDFTGKPYEAIKQEYLPASPAETPIEQIKNTVEYRRIKRSNTLEDLKNMAVMRRINRDSIIKQQNLPEGTELTKEHWAIAIWRVNQGAKPYPDPRAGRGSVRGDYGFDDTPTSGAELRKTIRVSVNPEIIDDLWTNRAQFENVSTGVAEDVRDVIAQYDIDRKMFPNSHALDSMPYLQSRQELEDYLILSDVMDKSPQYFGIDPSATLDPLDFQNQTKSIFNMLHHDGGTPIVASMFVPSERNVDGVLVAREPGVNNMVESASIYAAGLTKERGGKKQLETYEEVLRPNDSLISDNAPMRASLKAIMRDSMDRWRIEMGLQPENPLTDLPIKTDRFYEFKEVTKKTHRDAIHEAHNNKFVIPNSPQYVRYTKGVIQNPKRDIIDAYDLHRNPDKYFAEGLISENQRDLLYAFSNMTRNWLKMTEQVGVQRVIPDIQNSKGLRTPPSVTEYNAGISGGSLYTAELFDMDSVPLSAKPRVGVDQSEFAERIRLSASENLSMGIRQDLIGKIVGSDGGRFHTYYLNKNNTTTQLGDTKATVSDHFPIAAHIPADEAFPYISTADLAMDGVKFKTPFASAVELADNSIDLTFTRHIVNEALRLSDGSSNAISDLLQNLEFTPQALREVLQETSAEGVMGMSWAPNGTALKGGKLVYTAKVGEGKLSKDAYKYIEQLMNPNRVMPKNFWQKTSLKLNTAGVFVATTVDLGGLFILAPYAAGSKAGLRGMKQSFVEGVETMFFDSSDAAQSRHLAKLASPEYRQAATEGGVKINDLYKPDPNNPDRLILKSEGDFTLEDLATTWRSARVLGKFTPKIKGNQVRIGSFEQAFITMMNDMRVSGYIGDVRLKEDLRLAAGEMPLTPREKRAIGEAYNVMTAAPDTTKRGQIGKYVFFADGFFKSQRQLLKSVILDDETMTGAMLRNHLMNYMGFAMATAGLMAFISGRDPRDVLSPIDDKALLRGEIKINPNLGTIRLGEFDVDTLGWAKPFGNMMMSLFNTGVDVLDDDGDMAYNELLHGGSRFLDSKGSPVVRLAQEVLMKGGHDFEGRPVLDTNNISGTLLSNASRVAPIWGSQAVNEFIDEMKEAGVDGNFTAAELSAAGVDSLLQGFTEFMGLRVNPTSPTEQIRKLILEDKELNPYERDFRDLDRSTIKQFEEKYPGPFERYRDFERDGQFKSIQTRGWIEVEDIKLQLAQDIEEAWEDYSGLNQLAFSSRAEFVKHIQGLKREAAIISGDIRDRSGISFTPGGYAGEILHEYFKAYDDNTLGGKVMFDGVDVDHALLLKRIEAGEFGGDDPVQKDINLILFEERIYNEIGHADVDDIMYHKFLVAKNTDWYDLLDSFTKQLGPQFESTLGTGPIDSYSALTREIGYLENMKISAKMEPEEYSTDYGLINARLAAARKLLYRVNDATGRARKFLRAQNPNIGEGDQVIQLREALVKIGSLEKDN